MFLTNKLNFQILGVIQLYCEFSESFQKVTVNKHVQLPDFVYSWNSTLAFAATVASYP